MSKKINDKYLSVIEGLLFVNGDNGVSNDDIKFILDSTDDELPAMVIKTLQDKYKEDEASGLDIQKFAGDKYRLMTKKSNADFYMKLENIKTEAKLSTASLEALSIIAYKGPITRAEIEDLRGVNTETIIYKLKMRNLIEEAGKSEAIGKPMMYQVTDDFFKYFNINSIEDLPKLAEEVEGEKDIFSRGE